LLIATQGHFLQNVIGVVPLHTTIWSPAALIHEAAYAAAAIFVACRLIPKRSRAVSQYPDAFALTKPVEAVKESISGLSFAQRLETRPGVNIVISLLLAGWLYTHYFVKRLGYDINRLNTTLLLLVFLFYGSVKQFSKAIEHSVTKGWAIIVLYHLYGGVAGLVQFTNVGERVSAFAASVSNTATFPLITALVATVFACFIPSSGGQFAVQGLVTVKSTMLVGVSFQRGILALGVGDHMGNFVTPSGMSWSPQSPASISASSSATAFFCSDLVCDRRSGIYLCAVLRADHANAGETRCHTCSATFTGS
jgi:short-chain fatty acids transporter